MLMVLHQMPQLDSTFQVRGDHGCSGTEAVRAACVPDHVFCRSKECSPVQVSPQSLVPGNSWHVPLPSQGHSCLILPAAGWRCHLASVWHIPRNAVCLSCHLQELSVANSTHLGRPPSVLGIESTLNYSICKNVSLYFFYTFPCAGLQVLWQCVTN